MNTNILDYMYEGYGYDMDNQLLYTNVENYDKALSEGTDLSTCGMDTLMRQGVLSTEDSLPTEDSNKYTEVCSFISESGANYTDLRQSQCGCGKNSGN